MHLAPACAICFGCVVVGFIVGWWAKGNREADKDRKLVDSCKIIDQQEDAMEATRSPLPLGEAMRDLSRTWARRTSVYSGARVPIQSVGTVRT